MPERRRGALFFLLLISFLAAFPFRLERTYQFLRLRSIVVKGCPSVRIERRILSDIPSETWRFWPLAFIRTGNICDTIEKNEPLNIKRHIRWRKLVYEIKPLMVLSTFSWKGNSWYLSKEGRAWPESHPMNEELYGKPDTPSVVIDESMPPPVGVISGDHAVGNFLYGVKSYSSMVDNLSKVTWPGQITSLRIYREGGMELASIYIRKKDGSFVTVLVDREKDLKAQFSAANELLRADVNIKSGGIIDASYGGKIVVKGLGLKNQ